MVSYATIRPNRIMADDHPKHAAKLMLRTFLPYRLNVLANLASTALARVYSQRWGISIPEWRVLATLFDAGAMTQKAIGKHTHLDKTKISRAVASLEKRRLVSRRTNDDDKREAFLTLTKAGDRLFGEIAPLALAFNAELEATLDETQKAVLDEALTVLTRRAAFLQDGAG